jgi:hypothetical protein
MGAQFNDGICRTGSTNEHRRRLKRVKARVTQSERCQANALDINTVDLMDLRHQEINECWVVAREFDHEFIDDAPGAAFKDVDTRNVATDSADPAGQCTKRSRAIGHPHTKDVGSRHGNDATSAP